MLFIIVAILIAVAETLITVNALRTSPTRKENKWITRISWVTVIVALLAGNMAAVFILLSSAILNALVVWIALIRLHRNLRHN